MSGRSEPMETDIDVAFRGVTKRFGSLTALDHVDLQVRKGEFLSLLGPSGCGKTTSLRLMAGFEQPDEGEIVIGGTNAVGIPPYRRDVNTVFQSYALFPHMSVLDNVAYGLKQRRVPKAERYARAREALELVQLTGREKHRPSMLSGGQQQRVALARALVMDPRVLLLDEPLGALDQKLRKEMQVELKRIQETVGITFVYVTHDQEEALSMSDRVAVMSNGHIEQLDDPRSIYDRPQTSFVAEFIGEMNFFTGQVTATSRWDLRAGRRVGDRRARARRRAAGGAGHRRRPLRADDRRGRGAGAGPELLAGRGPHQDVPGRPDPDRRSPRQRVGRRHPRAAGRRGPGHGQRPPRRRHHRQLGRLSTPHSQRGEDACRQAEGGAMTEDQRDDGLRVLAPEQTRPKIEYMKRAVTDPDVYGITRRQLLMMGGAAALVAFAAACGTTTTAGGVSTAAPTAKNTLAGMAMENKLQIYNWSQYDAASTYKKFENLPQEKAAGLTIHETYYSSNDELLAKINAGAGGYDIIVPSQNAVAQLIDEHKLMPLDFSLIPNIKYLDPKFLKPSYDPTGQYHVIKDYGITMFFYDNKVVTEQPKTLKDFYGLLNKYVSKGRTNLLDGPEEVVPLALMALGLDPNTDNPSDLATVRKFPALHPQRRHDDRFLQLHQRRHRRQDHPRAGLERRRASHRAGAQEGG